MNKIKTLCICLASAGIILFNGCSKDDAPAPGGGNGVSRNVYIVNEGSFGSSDASISTFNVDSKTFIEDIFMQENQRPLGDVAQSMIMHNNKGYIVVNVSATVEVVNKSTFVSEGTITGFASPRFILPVNNTKAYVSDWSADNIKIVNLSSLSITGSIPAGSGPEQMVISGTKLFVTNSGGFSTDSTVTVIDMITDNVIATIQVGMNPNSIRLDKNGKVWVLCTGWYGPDFTGGTSDDVAGKLVRIDPATNIIEAVFAMGQFDHPVRLNMNKSLDQLFYLRGLSAYDGSVFKMNIDDASLPATPLVDKIFYGLGIDPVNGDIYGGYAPVFGQQGYMFRYESNGALKDSVKVGIGPNSFVFNY